jgi:hypothetical protein
MKNTTMKHFYLFLLLLFMFPTIHAQEELLRELQGELQVDPTVTSVFKGLKIVNLESTKLAAQGDLYFVIAHRFGSVKGGFKELYGLDGAKIRFSFVYGLTDWMTVGLSRSSMDKTYDVSSKLKIQTQEKNGFPFSIVAFGALAYKTATPDFSYVNFKDKHRVNYLAELLISRKMNEALSLQIAPIFWHENFTPFDNQKNGQYALGFGGRYKLSNRLTLNMDYVAHANRAHQNTFVNPLSIGFDIETGGHVFQLHFTNSQQMNDAGFLNATGDWFAGDIFFGFNLARVF